MVGCKEDFLWLFYVSRIKKCASQAYIGHRYAAYRIAADWIFSAFACRCREGEVFLARLRGLVAYKSRERKIC